VNPAIISAAEELDRQTVPELLAGVDEALKAGHRDIVVELGAVQRFDSTGLGGVVEGLRAAEISGANVRLRGLSQDMLDFFSLVSVQRLAEPPEPDLAPRRHEPITDLGRAVDPYLDTVADVARTAGRVLASLVVDPFRGRRPRLDRATEELDPAGTGALPIVVLIAFLLGLVLAMQAWVQLRVWGAEIYMADMVGVSVVTEIGPLMTAIILAARSGSRNAAQLGSMVVSEELDALRQMGIDPMAFLVVPKVVALSIAVFGLSLLFDIVAMGGGALFGLLAADIELSAYREQTQAALRAGDFVMAMIKSISFGALVGVVGCTLGLRVKGGSEGVGRVTTNSVVLSIFAIIVIDALFVTAQRIVLS